MLVSIVARGLITGVDLYGSVYSEGVRLRLTVNSSPSAMKQMDWEIVIFPFGKILIS